MNIQYISFDMPFGVRHVFLHATLIADAERITQADRPNVHHDALEFPDGQTLCCPRWAVLTLYQSAIFRPYPDGANRASDSVKPAEVASDQG